MDTAIQVIWWIGLIGAAALTAIILKEVVLVVRTLKDIHHLAIFIVSAGSGLARNLSVVSRMSALGDPAATMGRAALKTSAAAESIDRRLEVTTHGS